MITESKKPADIHILCTFLNAEGTLSDLLQSLLLQTHCDFVCLLVDDGSTDRSGEMAEAAARADGRFVVVRNPHPGRGQALNLGLSHAVGAIVAILDADDVAHPCWLARALAVISSEEKVAVLGCEQVLFEEFRELHWPSDIAERILTHYRDVTDSLSRHNPIGHSGALIRRKAIEDVGGYDTARSSQFDYDLWVRITANGGRLGKIDIPLVGKRIHPGQHFERPKHLSYVLSSLRVQRRAIVELRSPPGNYLWLLARLVWSFVPRVARMAIRKRR